MASVIVVGAGGHALVCVEVLRSVGHTIAGCLDDRPEASRVDVPVVGSTADLGGVIAGGTAHIFVAIGDNRTRQRMSAAVDAARGVLVGAISPHAVVSPSAVIGPGAAVLPGAVVGAGAMVGRGAILNTRSSVDHECRIGAWAHVGPGVSMSGDVDVGDGALIGVGAVVTPRRAIGAWSTVGAGAVVLHDVPDGVTVAGVPATTAYRSARQL